MLPQLLERLTSRRTGEPLDGLGVERLEVLAGSRADGTVSSMSESWFISSMRPSASASVIGSSPDSRWS